MQTEEKHKKLIMKIIYNKYSFIKWSSKNIKKNEAKPKKPN